MRTVTDTFNSLSAALSMLEAMLVSEPPFVEQVAIARNEEGLWQLSYPDPTIPLRGRK